MLSLVEKINQSVRDKIGEAVLQFSNGRRIVQTDEGYNIDGTMLRVVVGGEMLYWPDAASVGIECYDTKEELGSVAMLRVDGNSDVGAIADHLRAVEKATLFAIAEGPKARKLYAVGLR